MLVTVTTLGNWTGVHRDTIRKRLSSILTGERGEQVDSIIALPLIFGDGEQLNGQQERARLDRARREALELANSEKRRELISTGECFAILDGAAVAFREHLMAMAGRLSATLAHETDEYVINHTIETEVRAALTHLADNAKRFLNEQ